MEGGRERDGGKRGGEGYGGRKGGGLSKGNSKDGRKEEKGSPALFLPPKTI